MRARCLGVLPCLALALASCGSDDEDPKRKGTGGAGGTGAASSGGSAGSSAGGSSGASSGGSSGSGGVAGSSTGGSAGSGGSSGRGPFTLTSSAYGEGETIPQKHECNSADSGAQNASPPLAWTPGPIGTQSYALVMRDLDFGNGFLHWVMWDIPASTLSVPENVEHLYQPSTPAGAKQAIFQGAVFGYFGPCSPGVNTYEITVYALPDATLASLDQNSTKQEAANAIVDAALASATLSGES